jgi:hypothetical protein
MGGRPRSHASLDAQPVFTATRAAHYATNVKNSVWLIAQAKRCCTSRPASASGVLVPSPPEPNSSPRGRSQDAALRTKASAAPIGPSPLRVRLSTARN